VNFAIQKSSGENSNGDGLRVAWSLERDHGPIAVGTADPDDPRTGNAVLDAQIRAYFAAYRSSRGE